MSNCIKKIGECWITPETLSAYVPRDCVVNCEPIDMKIKDNFPALFKPVDNIKYEVYGKDREDYEDAMENVRNKITIKGYNDELERQKS